MDILNVISTIFWIALSLRCAPTFLKIHRANKDRQYLGFALNILLIAGLNICIGLYSITTEINPNSVCSLLQKFYFGTSLFQLLLSYCVIERIRKSL